MLAGSRRRAFAARCRGPYGGINAADHARAGVSGGLVLGCLSRALWRGWPRCELEFGRRRVVVRPRGCMSRRVAGLPDACRLASVLHDASAFHFSAAKKRFAAAHQWCRWSLLLKLIGGDAQQRSCSGNDRWRPCNHIGTARVLRREWLPYVLIRPAKVAQAVRHRCGSAR